MKKKATNLNANLGVIILAIIQEHISHSLKLQI